MRHFSATSRCNGKVADLSTKYNIYKNPCGIQHLSDDLHKQLFPHKQLPGPTKALTKAALKYLDDNELLGKPCSVNPPINFKLPPLQGNTINEHFHNLGLQSGADYGEMIDRLLKIGFSPLAKPGTWVFKSGWTRYAPNEEPKSVPYPLEDELVYDCEVMYKMSPYAVMATCLSPKAWYSWCSPYLTGEDKNNSHLIPFATDKRECLIVGHNVSFDRARVLEEYNLNSSKAFYLDTMSLHIAVSGMCSRQRGTWMKYKKNVRETTKTREKTLDDYRDMIRNEDLKYTMSNDILDDESVDDDDNIISALYDDPWMKNSSMNKLSDVAELHCGIKMEKQLRDHFATSDPQEIRDLFQDLMTYCANDVLATYHVFAKVYPLFKGVVPHPVSLAALRHINTSILPTSVDWEDYIHRCEKMYQDSKGQVEEKVHKICQEIVDLRIQAESITPPWVDDPWLSQLDWTISPIKMTKAGVPYKSQKLPGYPEWYKKLVVKNKLNLTIKSRCCSLLLRLLWENKPIFWTESKGWCFVVDHSEIPKFLEKKYIKFDPIDILNATKTDNSTAKKGRLKKSSCKTKAKTKAPSKKSKKKSADTAVQVEVNKLDEDETILLKEKEEAEGEIDGLLESDKLVRSNLEKLIFKNQVLFKIPHENGATARVTSLITKPFLRYYEEGILSSSHRLAKEAFESNVTNSYWVSSRERIMNQFVVYESNISNQKYVSRSSQMVPTCEKREKEVGVIIPQIVPMGTITRRAVEKTWLTASNAKKSRLGSELKSLIQAPPGYCFVGADVDSEELWIASLVGDSVFRLHGGTALGWMTLEGTKNAGTDLHSKTAKILGISRNEAKVFNYGRIYGAGVKFATSLLKKFNPSISDEKADEVAKTLYAETKGKTSFVKFPETQEKVKLWYGGSESVVFNRLEQIAEQDDPKTPVLGAGITAALNRTNLNSKTFLPSRINWAIQSSGVDYLHLLLVSMEYLTKFYGIDARLAITVHDEVRYLAKDEDRYKCAMLLQIANLWTRAMFCFQLGIENIPQSCAFFSNVDIDFVLRKEVDFDCITPSNPTPIAHGENLDIFRLLEKPEVQEMLNSPNAAVLRGAQLDPKYKVTRPVEGLDKKLDMATRVNWTRLQISKTDEEFKKKKKMFFQSADHSKLEKFEKTLAETDNTSDDVVCEGLFDSSSGSLDLDDTRIVLGGDLRKRRGKPSPAKTNAKREMAFRSQTAEKDDLESLSPTDLYVDVLADTVLQAASVKGSKRSKRSSSLDAQKATRTGSLKRQTPQKSRAKPVRTPKPLAAGTEDKCKTSFSDHLLHSHHHLHLTENELLEIHNS